MPVKKRAPGSPHRRVRRSCKHCRKRGHNHVPGTGNSHRFHGLGSFCATHSTTKRGSQYCTRQGIPRSRFGLGRRISKLTTAQKAERRRKSINEIRRRVRRTWITSADRKAARRGDIGYSKRAYRRYFRD